MKVLALLPVNYMAYYRPTDLRSGKFFLKFN
jgi:hypothetical protein